MTKILIVEDELKIANLMRDYLTIKEYEVFICTNGNEALSIFEECNPDIVLLDIMLPGKSGIEICRELRASYNVGIIMISAKSEEIDKLAGLELGADDYICKPFSPKEVVARVQSLMRRLNSTNEIPNSILRLDEKSYSVFIKNSPIDVTQSEFRLLSILFKHPGQVYSRSQLVDLINENYRESTDRAVDSHIKNLRKKIKQVMPENELIKSVYGIGYKLEL